MDRLERNPALCYLVSMPLALGLGLTSFGMSEALWKDHGGTCRIAAFCKLTDVYTYMWMYTPVNPYQGQRMHRPCDANRIAQGLGD